MDNKEKEEIKKDFMQRCCPVCTRCKDCLFYKDNTTCGGFLWKPDPVKFKGNN